MFYAIVNNKYTVLYFNTTTTMRQSAASSSIFQQQKQRTVLVIVTILLSSIHGSDSLFLGLFNQFCSILVRVNTFVIFFHYIRGLIYTLQIHPRQKPIPTSFY